MPKVATPQTDRDVINSIGADALIDAGFTVEAVKKWRQRGIPWKERATVAAIAKENRIRLPDSFLSQRAA